MENDRSERKENDALLQWLDKKFDQLEKQNLNQKETLTFEEAARYTGMSKSYLYKLTSAGEIPHYKPGGKRIFFDRRELEDHWLRRNRVHSRDEIYREVATNIKSKNKRL